MELYSKICTKNVIRMKSTNLNLFEIKFDTSKSNIHRNCDDPRTFGLTVEKRGRDKGDPSVKSIT